MSGQDNCSLTNICGSYGYCYTQNDELLCQCKFWWTGELCNQQSNSGVQVIILGCLTALVMFIFYGLKIGRSIYNKWKGKGQKDSKDKSSNPKLTTIVIEHVKRSSRLLSCITAVLVILVATGTLLAQWSLIEPIHNDIVIKYQNQKLIYYKQNSICNILDREQFNVFVFPFACLIIVICIILTKRRSFMRDTCDGYGGAPSPMDFLSHFDRKFAAVIFVIIANDLFDIVVGSSGSTSATDGVLVFFLLRLYQALLMGFRFYPILACVYMNSLVTLSCATLYAWLDHSFTIVNEGMCKSLYYPTYEDSIQNLTGIEYELDYYGTGSFLIGIQLSANIPKHLCLAYISIKLPLMLIEKIIAQRKEDVTGEKEMLQSLRREEDILLRISHPESIEMLYVKNLFRSAHQRVQSDALFSHIVPRFIYEWRDDFRFSSRVLCVYSSLFLLLFLFIIRGCVSVVPTLNALQSRLQLLVNVLVNQVALIIDAFNGNTDPVPMTLPLPNLVQSYLCAAAMTVIIIVVQLLVLLANIRRNLLQVYRGDDSEIPRRDRSCYLRYATGNFHFAGYFIGYLIWGFIIIAIFSTIVCFCIGAFIIYGSVRGLEAILKFIIPSILLIVFKLFLNKLLAQYVFLQHYGDVLALDNRRFLMIFIYFNFFVDAFLGFISAIIRLISSSIGGIIYMCRMDYSSLGRKLETFDTGFQAYCGFIHTECTHRHPVMLVFASHLFHQIRNEQYIIRQMNSSDLVTQENYLKQQRKSLRCIHKWRLAVFLIRNPSIVFFRKAFLQRLNPESRRALISTDDNHLNHIQREAVLLNHLLARPRSSTVSDMDLSQIIIQRF